MLAVDRLEEVRQGIAVSCQRSGRSPADLRLIAVTKTQDASVLSALQAAGVNDFGENRVEHLTGMVAAAAGQGRFHYIGRVQRRQFRRVVPLVESLHSLAELHHVDALDRACAELDRQLSVFVQVNTAGEAQKAGLAPDEVAAMCDACAAAEHLELVGLMCMAPDLRLPQHTESQVRRCFAACRALAERHGLARLSMGMSQDYQIAIEEGATDLRVGSVLFRT